jgi:hypothetical protein
MFGGLHRRGSYSPPRCRSCNRIFVETGTDHRCCRSRGPAVPAGSHRRYLGPALDGEARRAGSGCRLHGDQGRRPALDSLRRSHHRFSAHVDHHHRARRPRHDQRSEFRRRARRTRRWASSPSAAARSSSTPIGWPATPPRSPTRTSPRSSSRSSWERASASCRITSTRPESSWATPVRCSSGFCSPLRRFSVTGQVDPALIGQERAFATFMPIILPIAVMFLPLLDLALAVVRRTAGRAVAVLRRRQAPPPSDAAARPFARPSGSHPLHLDGAHRVRIRAAALPGAGCSSSCIVGGLFAVTLVFTFYPLRMRQKAREEIS